MCCVHEGRTFPQVVRASGCGQGLTSHAAADDLSMGCHVRRGLHACRAQGCPLGALPREGQHAWNLVTKPQCLKS